MLFLLSPDCGASVNLEGGGGGVVVVVVNGLCLVEFGNLASPSLTPEWPRPLSSPVPFACEPRSLVPICMPLPPLVMPPFCKLAATESSDTNANRSHFIFSPLRFSVTLVMELFAVAVSRVCRPLVSPRLVSRDRCFHSAAAGELSRDAVPFSRPTGHSWPFPDPSSSARDPETQIILG